MNKVYFHAGIKAALANQTPFGAALVNYRGDCITAVNSVGVSHNHLQHAEMNLLHKAYRQSDFEMKGLSLYSTGEPCPMCAGALVWAGIEKVYWGASVPQIARYFKQFTLSSDIILNSAWRPVQNKGGILVDQCLELFERFTNDSN